MIITCPSCSKRYMLDGDRIPPEGRQVRCASCQHVWRYLPEEETASRPLPFLGFPPSETTVTPPPFVKKRRPWIKWGILCLTGSVLAFFIFCRHTVVTLWPQAQKGYALIGLSARLPGEGLTITNPLSLIHRQGTAEMVVVAGDIRNTSPHVQTVPPLKITLTATPGAASPLDHWEHRLAENSLLPGETLHFETAPRPKVEGAHHVSIAF